MFKRAMGAYLLGVATQGWALSLGASSGAVIIGQPLDVQIRTAADASEWASGLCVQAEVFFGDSRLPGSAVELTLLPGQGETGVARLRSRVVVNEPVVTVLLSAGCADKFSRRYVFLSDFEPVAPVAVAPLPAASSIVAPPPATTVTSPAPAAGSGTPGVNGSAAVAAPAASASPASAGSVPTPSQPSTTSQPNAAKPATTAPKPRSAPSAADTPRPAPKPVAKPPVAATGPRLKLEPVDLAPTRMGQPGLKLQSELASEPTADDARRQEARDAWTAMNANPSELAAQREKVTALEKQLDLVRQEQQRMQATIETLNAQWREAEGQRYQNPLVYGLALSLLVALGLWWRTRAQARAATASGMGQGVWWESTQAPAAAGVSAGSLRQAHAPEAPDSLMEASDSAIAAGLHAVEHAVPEDHQPTVAASQAAATVSIDQLLDMVQQVDFFESLGQVYDAQRILRDFVAAHPAACELPYLLWLRHAKEMGDTAQRVEAARVYQQDFQTEPPSSSVYGRQAPGLDSDPAYLAELSKVWDSAEAFPLLERALLSSPRTDGPLKARTLESFEDLFTLYAVAQALQAEPASAANADKPSVPASVPMASTGAAAFAPTAAMDLGWQAAPEAPVQTAPMIDLDLSGLTSTSSSKPSEDVATVSTVDTRELPSLDFDFDLEAVSAKTPLDKPPI